MDNDQKEYLEETYDVYINIDTLEYNYESYDSLFGWLELPEEWLDEVNFFD